MPVEMILSMDLPSSSCPSHWMEPPDGLYQSGDGPQGGGLARAVGADQRDDLAVRYFQRNAPEGLNAAVVDLQVFNFKHRPPPPDTRR